MRLLRMSCIIVTCTLVIPASRAQENANRQPTLDRVDVTRWLLAFGRVDDVRPMGIQTPENPKGGVVVGITTRFPESQPVPPGTDPADPTYTILDWIASQPDKLNITLDQNPRDGKADDQPPYNALIIAGSRIPSGFTLVVAEGMSDPDGHPTRALWDALVPRYGGGNYYATVSVPAAGIVRGQELYTKEHFEGYAANSLIYEAPDSAFVIVDNALDGGTKALVAQAQDAPADPTPAKQSGTKSRLVGFADPLQVEIVEQDVTKLDTGGKRVRVLGVLDNNFEAVTESWFRWAIETNRGTVFVEIAASNVLAFDLCKPPPPGENLPPATAGIPQIVYDGGMIKLTLVVTSYGPGTLATTGVPPFVKVAGSLGNSVGLDSFISTGNTLSDTHTLQVSLDDLDEDEQSAVSQSICILLDASGSMKDDNKMEKAKASATRVLSRLGPQTEVALIVYYDCGSIVVESEFTTDKNKVLAILPRIQPSSGTPIAAATTFAKDYLRKHASGSKLDLIILTDGEETCNGDPIAAARD